MTVSYDRATSGGAGFWRDNKPEFVSIGGMERITGNDTRIPMVSHSDWPITPFRPTLIPAFFPRMIPLFHRVQRIQSSLSYHAFRRLRVYLRCVLYVEREHSVMSAILFLTFHREKCKISTRFMESEHLSILSGVSFSCCLSYNEESGIQQYKAAGYWQWQEIWRFFKYRNSQRYSNRYKIIDLYNSLVELHRPTVIIQVIVPWTSIKNNIGWMLRVNSDQIFRYIDELF